MKMPRRTRALVVAVVCGFFGGRPWVGLCEEPPPAAAQEEARQTFDGVERAKYAPPPMDASFLSLSYDPWGLTARSGLLGTEARDYPLAPSFFASVETRGEARPEAPTYWSGAAGFAYVAPRSQIFSNSNEELSETSQEFLEGIELTPVEDTVDAQSLLSLSLSAGVSRALGLWGPISLASSLAMTGNVWGSVADGDDLFIPFPDFQFDLSTALCYQAASGRLGAALSGGFSEQALGMDEGIIGNQILVFDNYINIGDLISYAQTPIPHGGLALWGETGDFSYGAQGRIMKTQNTWEQKYGASVGLKALGLVTGLSGEYRHESGEAIDFLRHGAALGLTASPMKNIFGGQWQAGIHGGFDHFEFGGAQRDAVSAMGMLNFTWGAGTKSKATAGAQVASGYTGITDKTVNLPEPEDYEDIQNFLKTLNWLDRMNYIDMGEYGDIEEVPEDLHVLAYNLARAAIAGNLTEGDTLAMSATYGHQLGQMAPLTLGDREIFKSYMLDNMAYYSFYYDPDEWEKYQGMSYEEKRDYMAAWLLERFPEGGQYVEKSKISSLLDSTGDYLFDTAYAKANQALMEARLAGESLNQVTVTGGLKVPDLSQNYLIEACRRAPR
ncbi:MAG: hypothetical protein HY547_09345 [Elusimicrobia bacterium]|nr:hypothetical protein [Elusimicrobiota bacterium]